MNDELFELCKQVYEATGWVRTHQLLVKTNQGVTEWHNNGEFEVGNMDNSYPLYTSDYLLEKLPPYIQSVNHRTRLTVRTKPELLRGDPNDLPEWQAMYGHDYSERADTPLKALLKLTLALHESGWDITKERGD